MMISQGPWGDCILFKNRMKIAAFFLIFATCAGEQSSSQSKVADSGPIKGKDLFTRNCVACHTIGHGDLIGPDLLGITRIRNRTWLKRMIQKPDLMLSEKDPIATALLRKYNDVPMPNASLGDQDTAFIISYIEAESAAHNKKASASRPARSSSTGNPPSPNR